MRILVCYVEVNKKQTSTSVLFYAQYSTPAMFIFISGAIVYFWSHHGAGTGPVYLDDIRCLGFEDSLINCSRSNFGDVGVNCLDHSEDASVICPSECH